MKTPTLLFVMAAVSMSCSVSHNIPNNQTPNEFVQENKFKVFVDQNGDFYPDDWMSDYGKPPKKRAYSLTALADNNQISGDLQAFRDTTLNKIKTQFSKKRRIYILIHGYNNCEGKAKSGFKAIEDKVQFNTQEDGIIEFYWDGLVASNPIESLDIWYYAVGYSQLAGERALRAVLNQFKNKEIVIITHSRGASVLLSALSDPPYNKDFANQTFQFHKIKVQSQPKLSENNNKIKAIMLAPALGQVDFRNVEYYTTDSESFRDFSPQLKVIHITVNKNDNVLKKYFKPLSYKQNPTDLGYNIAVYKLLKNYYPKMTMTNYDGLHSHNFVDYVNENRFNVMLTSLDIPLKAQ